MAKISIESEDAIRLFKKLKGVTDASGVFKRAFSDWAFFDVNPQIQENLSSILHRRTGALATRSELKLTGIRGNKIEGNIVAGGLPYAAIHEYGGTIKPKSSKYLAIPLDAAKTPAGVPRGAPRDFQDTFFFKSKAGNLLIGQKGIGGGLIPLFVLKKSVEIPKRRWASSAIDKTLPALFKHIDNEIEKIA